MKLFIFVAFSCCVLTVAGQNPASWDSLRREYRLADAEEKKIDILNELAIRYNKVSIDKSEEVALEALGRANAIQYQKGIGDSYNTLGVDYSIRGMYDKGLEFFLKALKIREMEQDVEGSAKVLNNLGGIFMYQNNYEKALEYSAKSLEMVRSGNNKLILGNALLAHGLIYEHMNDTSKALRYMRQSLAAFEENGDKRKQGEAWLEISELLQTMKKPKLALETSFNAMNLLDLKSDQSHAVELLEVLGQAYQDLGNDKTAHHYFHLARENADHYKSVQGQLSSRLKLSNFFEKANQFDSALRYRKEYSRINEETFSHELANRLALLEKVYETEQKDNLLELHQQRIRSQDRIIIAISIVLILSTITGFILYRYYRQKRKANDLLSDLNRTIHERNEEITAQSEELIEANEEIRRINESLEDEVNFRTEKIRIQNEKLIEYAYFNAHKVRGPLARILGLSMLVDRVLSPEETQELNNKIRESANELDDIIKAINKRLELE